MKKAIVAIAVLILPLTALAIVPVTTFSIAGCDPETGEVGVAVASKYFSVGSVVPWAKAGVGAVATQSYVNFDYGIDGLEMLEAGLSPQQVIDSLISIDPGYERRQVGVIDFQGNAATFTGPGCLNWAGGLIGINCAAQGNILVSDTVVTRMVEAFERTRGKLEDKLMAALLAGDSVGGDSRGKQSAALYVAGVNEGLRYDRKIDIRVDDSPEPFVELYRIFNIAKALSHLDSAMNYYRKGEIQMAVREARESVELGPDLPETYYDLACYLTLAGQFDEALVSIETAIKISPKFKNMAAGDSDLDGLKSFPEFQELLK
ncbi:MAG: DUF1028 domain-containing protein [candidate division Zixibacteria bacterium]